MSAAAQEARPRPWWKSTTAAVTAAVVFGAVAGGVISQLAEPDVPAACADAVVHADAAFDLWVESNTHLQDAIGGFGAGDMGTVEAAAVGVEAVTGRLSTTMDDYRSASKACRG